MKIGLSTASLYLYPLLYTFRLAKELGFQGLELSMGLEASLRRGGYLRRLAQEHDLSLFALHPPMFSGAGGPKMEEILPRMVELGKEAGCETLVVHAPQAHDLKEGKGLLYLDALLRAQESWRGHICLENRGFFGPEDKEYVLSDLRELSGFAQEHGLFLTLDTAHAASFGYDLLEAYQICRPRLASIHLSDYLPQGPLGQWHWFQTFFQHHQIPGEGVLPLKELLRRLREDGYSGTILVEISPFALQAWWPAKARAKLRRCLEFVQGQWDCTMPGLALDSKGTNSDRRTAEPNLLRQGGFHEH